MRDRHLRAPTEGTMARFDITDPRESAELVRGVELRILQERLCGTLLRRETPPGLPTAPMESILLQRDGEFVRETGAGAGATLRAHGRWTVEEFLDAPLRVLRQAGAVSTFLPIAVNGNDLHLLGGEAWRREKHD
jgi:hypothetical protein